MSKTVEQIVNENVEIAEAVAQIPEKIVGIIYRSFLFDHKMVAPNSDSEYMRKYYERTEQIFSHIRQNPILALKGKNQQEREFIYSHIVSYEGKV